MGWPDCGSPTPRAIRPSATGSSATDKATDAAVLHVQSLAAAEQYPMRAGAEPDKGEPDQIDDVAGPGADKDAGGRARRLDAGVADALIDDADRLVDREIFPQIRNWRNRVRPADDRRADPLSDPIAALEQSRFQPSMASLIVGGAALVVGVILLLVGINRLKVEHLVPRKTIHQVQEDASVAKQQLRSGHEHQRAA